MKEKIVDILEFQLFTINDYSLSVANLLSAFLILGVARLLVFLIQKILHRSFVRQNLSDKGKEYAINQILKYLIYTIAIVLVIESLGFNVTILIASSAALFVGIGLGLQDIFKDILSGVFLLFERTIQVGDIVEIDSLVGRVKEINIRTSKVRTRDGIMIIVPNNNLISAKVINWSMENKITRFGVEVGVAYGSNTKLVKDLLIQCAVDHPNILAKPEPRVFFRDFGNSSLDFEVMFWSDKTWEIEFTRSDLRFDIDQAFRDNGVTIPFPQRDLHVKSDLTKAPHQEAE